MTRAVIDTWLQEFVRSALVHDLQAHMALISPDVAVFGVPGFDSLGYQDWYRQCEHEFPQGLLADMSYSKIDIRTTGTQHILFKALESTRTAQGEHIVQGVEMLLQHADSGWKLKQLRLLPHDESSHDGLI
ncbi:MAG: nuclear transport factor 2 family protein [Gammaproteobacteria bacterium]|nr:nuclear transport factor 2 family protein [Gammaproteobacteria bacterium]MCP5317754.1 nuclear transport factor 2 family protein [Chromatiaceae bacterium]MCW5585648.1 nuclear transport factor 2 family protein [Chromatiales bacterium]MCB1816606.1 nuclear transport factor 2 family protein [Gammaproteobacteria bacterium]MCP5429230.1 nuclear transport factor 2 family protein [Chromatiaceae bacterium]